MPRLREVGEKPRETEKGEEGVLQPQGGKQHHVGLRYGAFPPSAPEGQGSQLATVAMVEDSMMKRVQKYQNASV